MSALIQSTYFFLKTVAKDEKPFVHLLFVPLRPKDFTTVLAHVMVLACVMVIACVMVMDLACVMVLASVTFAWVTQPRMKSGLGGPPDF